MEISRPVTPGYKIQTEATSHTKVDASAPTKSGAAAPSRANEPSLEALQHALEDLPEVDMDRVAQVKLALARGDINTDAATLAKDMLTHHRGSGV